MTHENPFLKVGPFKYEFLNRIPEVAYVHDLISKAEADKVLEVSRGKLKSTPYTYNGKYERYSKKRTSKVRYLSETHDNNAKKISDKVKQVTRFVMKGNLLDSENFQVMNYGLGGTIGIHIDESNKDGDRLPSSTVNEIQGWPTEIEGSMDRGRSVLKSSTGPGGIEADFQ